MRAAVRRAKVSARFLVLLGGCIATGTGAFAVNENEGWPVYFAPTAGAPAVADLDRDGHAEVIAASHYEQDPWIGMWDRHGNPLPGWPIQPLGPVDRTFTPCDIDNDGIVEVLANTSRRGPWEGIIHAYYIDTTEPPGWPLRFPWFSVPTPTVHDLDGDGRLETLLATVNEIQQTPIDSSRVHVILADGREAAGWPILFEDMIIESEIAIADLDLDGDMELIFGGGRYSEFYSSGWLYALHHDGTPFAADTVLAQVDRAIGPYRIGIANLRGDRRPEIMVTCARSHLHAFSVDGQPIDGWPPPGIGAVEKMPVAINAIDGVAQAIVVTAYSGNVAIYDPHGEFYYPWPLGYGSGGFQCQPLVADLDGDIDLEIFAGGNKPYIWALEQDGSNVEGWPYFSGISNFGTGTLADLDEDGDTDIVFQGYDAKIHVFDTPGKWDYKRIECGTWLYDNWHTGAYHKDLYREAESANTMIGFETVADTSACGHGAIRFAAAEARPKTITSATEFKVPATPCGSFSSDRPPAARCAPIRIGAGRVGACAWFSKSRRGCGGTQVAPESRAEPVAVQPDPRP